MKTNLHTHFKTNEKFAKEGVDYAINDKTSFRVAYFNKDNPRAKAAMAQHYKPFAKQIELGILDPEKNIEIQRNLFVDICLISWTGVEQEDGSPIEFTKENAVNLFKELPELFNVLWKHCNDFQNYKEDMGNL